MSRSYKKTPYYTDSKVKTTKENKRRANKKVRSLKIDDEFPSRGKKYKKLFESYIIHDYNLYVSKESWIRSYKQEKNCRRFYNTERDFKIYMELWEKLYHRK